MFLQAPYLQQQQQQQHELSFPGHFRINSQTELKIVQGSFHSTKNPFFSPYGENYHREINFPFTQNSSQISLHLKFFVQMSNF